MRTSLLKPGLLVSLKTAVRGGVFYDRATIEGEHLSETGARVSRWETTKQIPDPEEFERASGVRGKTRSMITAVCCKSAFGLLCPLARETELTDAIAEARKLASAYNGGTERLAVEVFVLVGRIAQDDAEAARAIAAEMRDLMDEMERGIKAADPDAIRDAANRARALGGMLSAETSAKVSEAIEDARKAAREIVKRVEKAGEQAATVVAEMSVARIASARFAFLDVSEAPIVASEAPAARGIDIPEGPDAPATGAAPALAQPPLEV